MLEIRRLTGQAASDTEQARPDDVGLPQGRQSRIRQAELVPQDLVGVLARPNWAELRNHCEGPPE